MTIFFIKSLLALLLLAFAAHSMLSMFTVFGRDITTDRVEQLKRRHRISGYFFLVLFLAVNYLCISYAVASRTEPSPRAALHILIAWSLAALLVVKVLFLRAFRRFYGQVKVLGTVIGIMSIVIVGISAGQYLTTSRFGQDLSIDRSVAYRLRGPFPVVERINGTEAAAIRKDRQSIDRGRVLFAARCAACHDPQSTSTIVGPGLKGLLRNSTLPKSGHPATAESIRFQLRQPLGRMPSFSYLSGEEMDDLIAYLNTL